MCSVSVVGFEGILMQLSVACIWAWLRPINTSSLHPPKSPIQSFYDIRKIVKILMSLSKHFQEAQQAKTFNDITFISVSRRFPKLQQVLPLPLELCVLLKHLGTCEDAAHLLSTPGHGEGFACPDAASLDETL